MHVAHRLERPGIASQFIITSFHSAGTQCYLDFCDKKVLNSIQ